MGTISLIILIFFLPYAWFLWSVIGKKPGKPRWKLPLGVFLALLAGSIAVNYYLSNAYELSFFQNGFESLAAVIISAAILLIVAIVNGIVSIIYKNAPKSVHNPNVVWAFTAVLCTTILFFTMWVYPLGEKAAYIQKVETALAASEELQNDEEITVLFLSSEKDCFRTSTSNCRDVPYKNSFFVKNNLEMQKEVQVRIRALDRERNELKTVESAIMTLEAGELRLVETEETSDMASIWSRSSFETGHRTHFYEALYQYRDAD